MKKIFSFLSIYLCIISLLFAQNDNYDQLESYEHLKNGDFGALVIDLSNKDTIYQYHSNKSMVPASVTKLFSTAAILESKGTNFTFKTKLYAHGKISNGVLEGDLILYGEGDPTLHSTYFEQDNFAEYFSKALKEKGITQINGRLIANTSYFPKNTLPHGWIWGDIGNYYGSGVHGINFLDNLIKLNFQSPQLRDQPTLITNQSPSFPIIQIENNVLSSVFSRDLAYIYTTPHSTNAIAEGSIPQNRTEFPVKMSNPKPYESCIIYLDSTIRTNGIQIKHQPISTFDSLPKNLQLLANYHSVPLQEIIKKTNEKSINLFAESFRLHLLSTSNRYEQSAISLSNFWVTKGIKGNQFRLKDGSGLSRSNGYTASHLIQLLSIMNTSKYSKSFRNSLAISGKTGTFRSMFKNSQVHSKIIGKSGSMERVRSYAGYIETKSGKTLAFAVMCNNFNHSSSKMRKEIAKWLTDIQQKE